MIFRHFALTTGKSLASFARTCQQFDTIAGENTIHVFLDTTILAFTIVQKGDEKGASAGFALLIMRVGKRGRSSRLL